MDRFGMPITSAAVPAFQQRPRESEHPVRIYGYSCGRITQRSRTGRGTSKNVCHLQKRCVQFPLGRSACFVYRIGNTIRNEITTERFFEETQIRIRITKEATGTAFTAATSGVRSSSAMETDRQVQLLQFPPPHQEGIRLRCVLRKTAGTARRPVLLQA